jgi:hypothetical protein
MILFRLKNSGIPQRVKFFIAELRVVGYFEFNRLTISSISHRWCVTFALIAGVTLKD